MRLLHRYILERLAVSFALTLVVITFIMSLGAMFQISDLLAKGVPAKPIAIIFFSGIPVVLAFSIPISSVTACLLVFERLSGDGEIAAMKACGVSMWQIVSRPVVFAAFLSCLCLYINTELVSKMHYVHRKTIHDYKHELAASFWEPGEFVRDIPGLAVYVGRSSYDPAGGEHVISDVIIYDSRSGAVEQEIRARSGRIAVAADNSTLAVSLRGVRVDPLVPDRPGAALMETYTVTVDTAGLRSEYRKRMADRTAGELLEGIMTARREAEKGPAQARTARMVRMSYAVELNQRIVLSLSCLAFVLLGIPLGVTTRRSSSTVGIAISMLMVFSFYLFILLVDSLAKHPAARPDLIIWIPAAVSIGLGLALLRRIR